MSQKIVKYLFIPGFFITSAGLVLGLTSKTWPLLASGLVTSGVIILIIWLGFILFSAQGFWQRRSTQAGTNALIATVSVLAIIGLINFLAVRYSLRIDLTENQQFTLSPQSQELIKNLQEPVKVWIFEKSPNSVDQELLNSYRRYSPNLEFEFVDPDLKPGLVKQFAVKSLGDVYLEYGEKKQLIQNLKSESLSEIKLSNGIEKILRDRSLTVYFLQGHGEHPLDSSPEGLEQVVSNLKDKGYNVEPLNLAESSQIPDNADVIIMAGPKRKLFPQEAKALKQYTDQGGNLLILLDPTIDPGLADLFKEWGIELDNRLIIDGSGAGSLVGLGPATPFITNYGDHPITKDFQNGISFYPLARPIATKEIEGVKASALLLTNEKMWAESDLESEALTFDDTQDIPGPFDLGVALTRSISPQASPSPSVTPTPEIKENSPSPSPNAAVTPSETPISQANKEAKMVVIGNSTFATNGLFEQQLNGDVFLNSVQWLASDDQQLLSIRAKDPTNRRIVLSSLQAGLIFWLSIVVFPLLGFILAGVIWWQKR
jgi:ABC-type uncharacterized transport system involved in gliding motility auxiliary subunit